MVFSNRNPLRAAAMSVWFLTTGLLNGACNGLFYYPHSAIYATPSDFGHEFTEKTIYTSDSLSLAAWQIHAHGSRKGVVLHFHGNAENMSTHQEFVQWLAYAGFEVLTFDYRGYGRSKGKPTRDGLVADGAAALQWAAALAEDMSVPLFVYAQSLGGAVAIPVVAKVKPERLAAMIVESSFASYRGVAREKLASFWLTWPFQWPLSYLVSDNWSPRDFVGELRFPLLVIHSPDDPVVPYSQGKLIADLADASCCRMMDSDGGHTSAVGHPASPWRNVIIEFFIDSSERGCVETAEQASP